MSTPTVKFPAVVPPALDKLSCADFMGFYDALKKARVIDDKIIYELNTTVPTDSFAKSVNVSECCENLYKQLRSSYDNRSQAITRCISETQSLLDEARKQLDGEPDNVDMLRRLRRYQSNLRIMESEVNVEEVVKDRSMKAHGLHRIMYFTIKQISNNPDIPDCEIQTCIFRPSKYPEAEVFFERCRNVFKPPGVLL